jgi:D-alanyl-D-alanine carboxypeptidase
VSTKSRVQRAIRIAVVDPHVVRLRFVVSVSRRERAGVGMRSACAIVFSIALMLSSARPLLAGHIVFDVADRQILDAVDADAAAGAGRAADLLLIAVLHQRINAGALALTTRVPVLPVAGDRGPHLSVQEPVEIRELLQLLLLTDSRTAAKTLAWAAGPSIGRTLIRMHDLVAKLGLTRTVIPEDWPFTGGANSTGVRGGGATTARELGRLALAVVSDPEIRRRLSLDGVPIADGSLIVRATAPLVGSANHATGPGADGESPLVQIEERGGLTLMTVATGPKADDELAAAFERGFRRYRRVELVHAGQPVGPAVHVRGGIIPSFKAIAAEAWALTTATSPSAGLAVRLQLPAEIDAPVEVHQPLGELVVEHEGRVLAVVPLVAPQAIAPSGWLDTARRSAVDRR